MRSVRGASAGLGAESLFVGALASVGVLGAGTVLLPLALGLLSVLDGIAVAGELVGDGAAFGSVGDIAAAPLGAAVLSLLGDCECDRPTAALNAAAVANATQVIGLLMIA